MARTIKLRLPQRPYKLKKLPLERQSVYERIEIIENVINMVDFHTDEKLFSKMPDEWKKLFKKRTDVFIEGDTYYLKEESNEDTQ